MEQPRISPWENASLPEGWSLPLELLELAREGEIDLVSEVFAIFRSDTGMRLEALGQAIAGADMTVVRKQAHALKGSSGQVGATALAQMCRQMEESAANGNMADVNSLLHRMQAQFEQICCSMASLDLAELACGR